MKNDGLEKLMQALSLMKCFMKNRAVMSPTGQKSLEGIESLASDAFKLLEQEERNYNLYSWVQRHNKSSLDALKEGLSVWDYCHGSAGSREEPVPQEIGPVAEVELKTFLDDMHSRLLPGTKTKAQSHDFLSPEVYTWYVMLDVMATAMSAIIEEHFPPPEASCSSKDDWADDAMPF